MYFIAFDAATMAVFVSNDLENASQRMNEELYIVTHQCAQSLDLGLLFITLCPIRYGRVKYTYTLGNVLTYLIIVGSARREIHCPTGK